MSFKTYFMSLTPEQREDFADSCETSRGHLQNVAYGYRTCSPELAVAIERESKKAVSRTALISNWQAIWPELFKKQKKQVSEV